MNKPDVWQGRIDAEDGERGLRWHQLVEPWDEDSRGGVTLLGFASDEGVRRNQGRVGAKEGPRALRRALAPLAWHGAIPQAAPLRDAGDVACDDGDLERAQRELGARVAALRSAGAFPMLLGGGHEIAWGSFQGLLPGLERDRVLDRFGIVNFDAHFDLRLPPRAGVSTSGTPFRQIHGALEARGAPFHYLCLGISPASNTAALYDAARSVKARWIEDDALAWPDLAAAFARIDEFIDGLDVLQLSVCLDAFPASAAPGVSAPAARGLPVDVGFALLGHLLRRCRHGAPEGRIRLAEVAELCPPLDPDGRTARLAGRIVYELVLPLTRLDI